MPHFSDLVYSAGMPLLPAATLPFQPGNIWFVDSGGSDGNPGTKDLPFATLAVAIAAATDANDDVIFIRGNFYSVDCTVNKEKLHIFGANRGNGISYYTRLNNGGASLPTIKVQARDVEIAHLMVLGDRGNHYPGIFYDGDNSGTRGYVHHVFFPGLTPSGSNYNNGIDLLGDRHVVEHCTFDSSEVGIRVFSQVQATYEIQLLNNKFYACDVGILFESMQEGTGQHGGWAIGNIFDGQGAHSEDRAIKVLSGTPLLAHNFSAAYTTDFTVGSAKIIENYNEGSGGTKITS